MSLESGKSIGIFDLQQHALVPSLKHQDKQQARHRDRVQVEIEPKESGLADEVGDIKKRGETEMYLLPGTGFQVRTQVDLLLENYRNGVPISDTFQQLEQDIQGFKTEYLVELPVFPIVLEKKTYDEKTRLVGALYGGRPFADAISEDERHGVVKKSAQEIEEILLDAAPGTMVVMTSPKGWSGYQSKDNRIEKLNPFDVASGLATEIRYPDTQTYCYEVLPDGSIRGFTLKTDMNLFQNKRLLIELGLPEDTFGESVDTITDIKRVVENVVIIDPEKHESIEGIAQKIRRIKNSEIAYYDNTKTPRLLSEMIDLLQNPESLWTLDARVKSVVDPLLEYVSSRITDSDVEKRSDLETALGLTVLKLMDKVRPRKKDIELKAGKVHPPTRETGFLPFNPYKQLEELQKVGGCAGGGNKKKDLQSGMTIQSLTPRIGVSGLEDEKEGGCGCENKDDNHYHCPKESGGCGRKYSDETQKSQEDRTKECNCGFKFGC